ncbi:MAG: TetR/AcrR family transcriptional regulator [Sinobacteraceae bacterium]|nr:TetR/AcrR family transcriptional regulator [Nevskiaceae bacterium]
MIKIKKRPPRWKRRAEHRPDEIIAAALEVFADKGFAAATVQEVARRADVAKSLIYAYFDTKEELFRAVVQKRLAPNLESVQAAAQVFDGPFTELVPAILIGIANAMRSPSLPAIAKVVIGESRNFPDLARIWHDDLLAKTVAVLAEVIRRAQARQEVKPGDARLYVFSIVGPMVMAMLYRSVFQGISREPPDLEALAAQHAQAILPGLLCKPPRRKA